MSNRDYGKAKRSTHGLMKRFLLCTSGATAIEYAMIAGALSIVIIGTVYQIGSTVQGNFDDVQDAYPEI